MNELAKSARVLLQLACVAGCLAAAPAWAQFTIVPTAQCEPPRESPNEVEQEYRIDASRHLYKCFPMRIYKGKLPPLLYGVMMVETELDAAGNVLSLSVVRKPAADEVQPWVLALIRRAAPFPAPAKFPGGTLRFTETFFVDKSGLFQAMSITEGQR